MIKKNKNIIDYGLIALTLLGVIYAIHKLLKKNKMILVQGEYTVPENIKYRADALHSFESRRLDGFGGRMSTKIREAMRKLYNEGINPDVSDIQINVDSKTYTVKWSAKVHESKDNKAYVGISTVGSAGSGADSRASSQIAKMKTWVPGAEDYTLVLDFKNPTGVYIRQYFYKYTKPEQFPSHK